MGNMIYAGIGSRQTPDAVLRIMFRLARELNLKNYQLRSGGAIGADSAFMAAADNVDLWLPFDGYNNFKSDNPKPTANDEAFASKYHPNWKACSPVARKMHARNCNIMLGADLDDPIPVDFVICWTPNAEIGGGTGQALRIAEDYDIPVFNLGKNCFEKVLAIKEFVGIK